ncbi:MAG: hypothetical protein WAU35_10910 [Azonexus sp.]
MSSDIAAEELAPVAHSRNVVFFVVALFPVTFSVAGLLVDGTGENLSAPSPVPADCCILARRCDRTRAGVMEVFVSVVFLATTITTRPLMRTPIIAE